MKQRFKLAAVLTVDGNDIVKLEDDLNIWAKTLPEGTRIRRTQLTAAPSRVHAPQRVLVVALINYEEP